MNKLKAFFKRFLQILKPVSISTAVVLLFVTALAVANAPVFFGMMIITAGTIAFLKATAIYTVVGSVLGFFLGEWAEKKYHAWRSKEEVEPSKETIKKATKKPNEKE